jgi:hypothetical protein
MNHPVKSCDAGTSIMPDKREVDVVAMKMNYVESGNVVK